MKLSFYTGFTNTVASLGVEQTREFMRSCGLDGAEFFCFGIPKGAAELADTQRFGDPATVASVWRTLRADPIPLCCYSVAADFIRWGIADTVNELKLHVDAAAALGSPYFHHTSALSLNGYDGADHRETMNMLLDPISRVAEYALSRGVIPLYEPQGAVFNGLSQFGEFIHLLRDVRGLDRVGVCMDFGNTWFADTDPVSFLREFLPLVRHVHLKDYRLSDRGGSNPCRYRSAGGVRIDGVPFTQGDSRLAEGVKLLLASGYDGWFSVESDREGVDILDAVAVDSSLIRAAVAPGQ